MSQEPNTTRVRAAMFALTMTLVAALAGLFLMIQALFPWMTVMNPKDVPASDASAVPIQNVTNGGPTPAERVLREVMATKVADFATAGWEEVSTSGGVPGVSFGFGCEPTDGLAPVVAEARTWVRSVSTEAGVRRAVSTVDVSARAYPAGGGAIAFTGVAEAVLRCEAASRYDAPQIGVEAFEVVTSRTRSLVWRRGDVLMVATASGSSTISAHLSALSRFDRALQAALAVTCVDPNSGARDATRSPYVDRRNFAGNFTATRIKDRKHPRHKTAEARTTDRVVKIPGRHIPVPYVSDLPSAPYPPVTVGPTALPDPVAPPTDPTAPGSAPANVTSVPKQIDDPEGPGCGWTFTGQVPPNFDEQAAQASYRVAVRDAKHEMSTAWAQWQEAKLAYYAAYAKYVKAAKRYLVYTEEVNAVTAAWAIVESARADYYAALSEYDAAVSAVEQWVAERVAAREAYRLARQACREKAADDETPPSELPSATPSEPVDPETSEPELVCPPVRPQILDEVRPTVPTSPIPAPEAQLPTPKDSPTP